MLHECYTNIIPMLYPHQGTALDEEEEEFLAAGLAAEKRLQPAPTAPKRYIYRPS
jgi:hypothetical protein